jgi:ABC-2 type transport system permease protein
MRQLWTMTASDLRQRVRDKSVIIFAVVVPLALMFVFNLTFGGVDDITLDAIEVAVSVPEGDDLAAALVDGAFGVDAVQVTRVDAPPDEVRGLVESGDVALGIVVPDGFGETLTSGREAVVDVIEGDAQGLESSVVITVLDAVLDRLTSATVAATAGAMAGLPHEALVAVGEAAATAGPRYTIAEGEASTEQLSFTGSLVAGQAGLFLLFTVGFGVLGLLAEREQGTLSRLTSMPMRPGLIVAAKGLVAYILGVVATAVLLTAGSLAFGVDFGAPLPVAALILSVVAAGVSLVFIIARVARTAEQAQISQSILAMVLGMSAGAFFPITASGFLGTLIDLNPIAAFMHGLGITTGGGGLADIGQPVAVMLGFAVIAALLSRLVPDRGAAS